MVTVAPSTSWPCNASGMCDGPELLCLAALASGCFVVVVFDTDEGSDASDYVFVGLFVVVVSIVT